MAEEVLNQLGQTREEVIKGLLERVEVTFPNRETPGGQSCGMQNLEVTLTQPEFPISISCGAFRSRMKNKEYAMMLMELAVNDLLR